jgi:hypothetical protein
MQSGMVSMNLDEFFGLSSKQGERERREEEISQTTRKLGATPRP